MLPSLEEQQKIGEFFSELDERIELQKSKIEKMTSLKKAYLSEMFPAEGETTPKRRFKGFTGEWEAVKLGEIVEFFSGLTYSPQNVINGAGTLVLRSSNVRDGRIIDNNNVYVKNEVVNSEYIKKGDIIVVVRNGSRDLIGKHAQIKHNMTNTVIGAFMTGIRASVPNFINSLLDTHQFINQVNQNLGATINQITTGAFKEMKFIIPTDIQEQQKIGEFFSELDEIIELNEEKLKKLQDLKQAYLNELLI